MNEGGSRSSMSLIGDRFAVIVISRFRRCLRTTTRLLCRKNGTHSVPKQHKSMTKDKKGTHREFPASAIAEGRNRWNVLRRQKADGSCRHEPTKAIPDQSTGCAPQDASRQFTVPRSTDGGCLFHGTNPMGFVCLTGRTQACGSVMEVYVLHGTAPNSRLKEGQKH